MKRFFRPLVLLLLAGMVALSPLCALAQEVAAEEEAPITHTAIASVALKVRRSPSKDASAGDSITLADGTTTSTVAAVTGTPEARAQAIDALVTAAADSLGRAGKRRGMVQGAHHPHGGLRPDPVSGRHHPL